MADDTVFKFNPQTRGEDQGVSTNVLVQTQGQSGDTEGYSTSAAFPGQFPPSGAEPNYAMWNQIHPMSSHGKADGYNNANELTPYTEDPAAGIPQGEGAYQDKRDRGNQVCYLCY